MTLLLPPLDGRVALKGLLGEGGMGQVHRAWDATLQRAAAVKFVRGSDPQEADRLLLEARLQARVEHPHVVRVHEVGTLGGRPCIVMQLVEGGTLADLPAGATLALRVELLRQAALGLHAAHLQGLIHRDMKPGNVLREIAEDGSPRALVTDFGLARDEDGGLTRSGLPAGTLDFMAPEVLLGAAPLDFRVDVYALGATAYALLAGHPPFRATRTLGPDATTSLLPTDPGIGTQLLRRILEEDPAPLKDAPRDLQLIVAKAMEKAPAERYGSAEAFAEDLGRFQRGEPILARRATSFDRLLKWSRRNSVAARALGAATLAVVLGLGFGIWTTRRAARQSLEAAHLGAEAVAMEELIRSEHLLPPHDLRPAYDRIRGILLHLPAHASLAPGPAAFVQGRGLQLLGRTEAARVALARAWALGYRAPAVARALGEAEGQRYAEELALLPSTDDPALRQAHVQALQARFRDPALVRLRAAAPDDATVHPLLAARMALVEERFQDAARLAAEASHEPARAAEAAELEGRAWLAAGTAAFEGGDLPEGSRQLQAAATALRAAAGIARSDQAPRLLLVETELRIAKIAMLQGGPRLERLDPAEAALREAAVLVPDTPDYLTASAELESERARLLRMLGRDASRAREAALDQARRAAATAADPRRALERLAWACVNAGDEVADGGTRDPEPVWAEGLAAAARARALSPDSSVPLTLETQMLLRRADRRSERGGEGLADAEQAAANAKRLMEIGDRPVVARSLAAQALRAIGLCHLQAGGDPGKDFAEANVRAGEVIDRSKANASSLAWGIYIAAAQVEADLAEGRVPTQALTLGTDWAERLLAQQKDNLMVSGQVGEWLVWRARAEALAGRDPQPLLTRAERLLLPAARSGQVTPLLWQRLAEAALERAAWVGRHGGDRRPALASALAFATQLQQGDPSSSEGPLLEGRVLLERSPADPVRALALADRATQLNPRSAAAWLLLARARLAEGRPVEARAALDQAASLRPRLAGLADCRARLGR